MVGYSGGTEQVRELWAKLEEAKVPVAGFWLQDWSGLRGDAFGSRVDWNWASDYQHYRGWDELVAELTAAGIKVMTYINPYLASSKVPAHQPNLFKQAAAAGYMMKNSSGLPYIQTSGSQEFTFGTVDLTNPDARAWYRHVIQCNMLRVGEGCGAHNTTGPTGGSAVSAAGWMSDFGEYIPMDAVLHTGTPQTVHNAFPVLWSELNRDAIRAAGMESSAVFFSRSSGATSPRSSSLFWMGDQLVTFDANDGMQSAVLGMLNSGVVGQSMTHSDVGGYTMLASNFGSHVVANYSRSRELLFRWTEMSAWSDAMLRTHQGNLPQNSAQIYSDAASLEHFARFTRVHRALGAYRRELMSLTAATGVPIARHPWLHYHQDPVARDLTTQFMLGANMMIAPVFAPNVSEVEVYLPDEQQLWMHWRVGETYKGGQWHQVAAAIGEPAVFAKSEFSRHKSWTLVCSILNNKTL